VLLKGAEMELKIGTQIRYTSAAGTRTATISSIKIAPTAKPGFLNTWLTLNIPVQHGVKFNTQVQIPADNGSISAFQIEAI
jgi:hypothetical protein